MRSWLGNQNLHHPLTVPVLLIAAVVAVYYPALLSGFHFMDDPGIVSLYSVSPPLSQILLPGNGYYYRPLVELTYWADNRLWGMEPAVMHLESILLHCANSLLLFLLARRMPGDDADEKFPLVPLLAALLFALHPVNVEAVAWIAGRTDPLLTLFVLSACLFWLRWLDKPRWRDLSAALLLLMAALLTKETALAAGAVAFLLALKWPGAATMRQRMTGVAIMTAPGMLLLGVVLFVGGANGLSRFISGPDLPVGRGMWDALIALGFYAKTLVCPLPLNAAITAVHPLYGLVGVALLPALCRTYSRRRLVGILFVSSLLLALPAVVVAVKQVAWTPFAERYMYLPSAFFCLGLSLLIRSGVKRFRGYVLWLIITVLAASAGFSMQRTMLWNNKFAFVQDAVAKSPGFGSLYNELGARLIERAEIEKAADAFEAADKLNTRHSMRLPIKANLLGIQLTKGDYSGVRESFFQLFEKKQDAPEDFLILLYKADDKRMNDLSGTDRVNLATDLLETMDLLYQKSSDPFWLYRSGQLSLTTGDEAKAADFLRRSIAAAPADAHYRPAAGIYLERLGHPQ